MSITITRPTKIVDLCVNMGLQADWEAASKALTAAKEAAARDDREADTSVLDAAQAVKAIEAEMLSHTLRFTLTALRRKEWAEHVASHPAREGDELDKAFGVDVTSLDDAIQQMITTVTAHDGTPVEFDPADWPTLADDMTNPQWEAFALAVLALNQGEAGGTRVPFSPAASLAILRSERTSKPQSESGSPSAGSKGGSRGRRTSTTTRGA